MAFSGGLISLVVALTQEFGIALGVGAITITLVAHLLALHSRQDEALHGYVHAAIQARAVALMLVILSGVAAVLFHLMTSTPEILLAPAFLFKWLIIALLTSFYFWERGAHGYRQDVTQGLEGANWYALFIVHTMASIVAWGLLVEIYAGWVAAFALVWAVFIFFLRYHSTIPEMRPVTGGGATDASVGKTGFAAGAGAPPSPSSLPGGRRDVETPAPSAPASVVVPTIGQVSAPIPLVSKQPDLKPQPKVEVHPGHSLLPMIAELDLPAPMPHPVTAPAPMPVSTPVAEIKIPNLDEGGLPGVRVMPKRPEDIAASNRQSSVKFEQD